jgi:predicted transcriptional regulator
LLEPLMTRPRLSWLLIASLFSSGTALAAAVGETVEDVTLTDGANDKPTGIPDLGSKVVTIFYTDADVADMNDPLADALKKKDFDKSKYRGMGVANLSDSKAPNFIIRKVVKGKIDKYKSTILTDSGNKLAKAWKLGDCNNTSVVMVIGRDKKVHHVQRGEIRGKDVDAVVALVEKLINEAPAAPAPAAVPAPAAPAPAAAAAPVPAEPAPAAQKPAD